MSEDFSPPPLTREELTAQQQADAQTQAAETLPGHINVVYHDGGEPLAGVEATVSSPQTEEEPAQNAPETEQIKSTEDLHPGEEGRWDHDKAESLGRIVKEEGRLDKELASREENRSYYEGKEYAPFKTAHERRQVELYQQFVDHETGLGREPLTRDVEDLEKAKTRLSEAEEKAHVEGQKEVQDWLDEANENVDKLLSPYERLYGLNPDLFKDMPTSEFMKVGKELGAHSSQFNRIMNDVRWMERSKAGLTRSISKKSRDLEGREADEWARELGFILDTWVDDVKDGDSLIEEVEAKREKIRDDWFDISPRQRLEAFAGIIDEYMPRIQDRVVRVKADYQAFIGKYKPQTEAE